MFLILSKGLDTDIVQRLIEPSREGKCPFFSFGKKSDLVQVDLLLSYLKLVSYGD